MRICRTHDTLVTINGCPQCRRGFHDVLGASDLVIVRPPNVEDEYDLPGSESPRCQAVTADANEGFSEISCARAQHVDQGDCESLQGSLWDHDPETTNCCDDSVASPPPGPSEQEAAATFARECIDRAAVIRWCANRVRWVDGGEAVQDAAGYLQDLATLAQGDTTPVTDRPAVIRWCAQQIHSMGGDADVERAAEYLDDLAVEAQEVRDVEQAQANLDALADELAADRTDEK